MTTAVADLWRAHRDTGFPRRFRRENIAGVEMVTLDADVAGCVSAWLAGGKLDDRRWDVLAGRERDLERVLPELTGDEATCCRRLLALTGAVLQSPDDHPPVPRPGARRSARG